MTATRREVIAGLGGIIAAGVAPAAVSGLRRGLAAHLAAFGGKKGWKPVENSYIETNGAVFKTGWSPHSTTDRMLADARIGSAISGVNAEGRCYFSTLGASIGGVNNVTFGSWTTRKVLDADLASKSGIFDGSPFSWTGNDFTISNSYRFFLGGRNNWGTADNVRSQKFYRFAVWRDGEILHDYYPREMDGVAGFFDLVNNSFLAPMSGTAIYRVG